MSLQKPYPWQSRPAVMGIINLSHDSFYQPALSQDDLLFQADAMVAAGVDIIDVGAEATNPNVTVCERTDASIQQELECVAAAVHSLKMRFDGLISVDTSQPKVMSEVIAEGADMINDQRALSLPGALAVLQTSDVPVCLMHGLRHARSASTSSNAALLAQVIEDLQSDVDRCSAAGILPARCILDPGFGFGKSLQHNFVLLENLEQMIGLSYPVLAGMSRKSMIGQLLNAPVNERLAGSIACATIAALKGAHIIRVHDVKESVQAVRVVTAMQYGA